MNRYAVVSAALLSTALLAVLADQAHAQAVVEDPGYCAQYYPNSNCTNYGPGNPLYPGSHTPAGPAGNYPSPYASVSPYAPGGPVIVHHRRRHHAYRSVGR
jgi:hypothetical protein